MMKSCGVDWEHCRSLLAVLRHGNLSAAARARGLTQPTLGRHIAELERSLGAALFTRSPHGLRPTETALAVLPYPETMTSAAEALIRTASGLAGSFDGTVRVAASEMIGVEVLPPILAELRAELPQIRIELALSNLNEDLLRHEADVAVRMARPTQAGLVTRRVGSVFLGLYAHRTYIARCGLPGSIEELGSHALIGFDREWPEAALKSQGLHLAPDGFALRTDSDLAQLAALRCGLGVGIAQAQIVRRDPDLVPLLADAVRFELPMWVARHEDLQTARVRTVFSRLANGLERCLAP
jgi:DNA-binding transcriptional LysR family regulator